MNIVKSCVLATFVLASTLPVSAQSISQVQQENVRLRAQLQALQANGCGTTTPDTAAWTADALSARLDTIRVGARSNRSNEQSGHVTVTMTLRNTGNAALTLNYQSGTFRLVDDEGRAYSMVRNLVSGIPTATKNAADSTAIMPPGSSRTVTFSAYRVPSSNEVPARYFDMNATFIQIDETQQGRIRKIRDYPVAFTNAPASGGGFSSGGQQGLVPQATEQLVDKVLRRLIK